jgi:uncharacterized damage-inducible protein DinB
MELLDYLRRQFTYDAWANREVLTALGESRGPKAPLLDARPLKLLAHVLSAERLWLDRIQSQPPNLPVWPDFTMERCRQELEKTTKLWSEHLAHLSDAQLSEKIRYKNSKGEGFTSSVEHILTHVLLHSAYHRGQIASQMRADGSEPAYTDFIHATRQGLIE